MYARRNNVELGLALPPSWPQGSEARTKSCYAACCHAPEHGDFGGILERAKSVCVRRRTETGLWPLHPKGAFPEAGFVAD
jgi:hypothetical protein